MVVAAYNAQIDRAHSNPRLRQLADPQVHYQPLHSQDERWIQSNSHTILVQPEASSTPSATAASGVEASVDRPRKSLCAGEASHGGDDRGTSRSTRPCAASCRRTRGQWRRSQTPGASAGSGVQSISTAVVPTPRVTDDDDTVRFQRLTWSREVAILAVSGSSTI